jgi:excisionase family DNA binding protein
MARGAQEGELVSRLALGFTVPEDFVRLLAAEVVDELERRGVVGNAQTSPWLSSADAAEYLRCSKQRVFDLTSQRRLRVAKDGSRSLYRQEWLDAYLEAGEA